MLFIQVDEGGVVGVEGEGLLLRCLLSFLKELRSKLCNRFTRLPRIIFLHSLHFQLRIFRLQLVTFPLHHLVNFPRFVEQIVPLGQFGL